MDPVITAPFPFLIEHTIWVPGAIKDENAIASPLEDFCRDFDDHILAQLEGDAPWLRTAYEEACGMESDPDDYEDDEMAAGIFRAVGRGEASGWLVQLRVPTPPKNTWGAAWLIWAYGPTVQDAIAKALVRGRELRSSEEATRG